MSQKTKSITSYPINKLSRCIVSSNNIFREPSDAFSHTLQLELKFKKGMTINGEKLKKGFLKLSLDSENYTTNKYTHSKLESFKYEGNIYENIIQPMNMHENFVTYIGRVEKCSYNDILRIFGKTKKNKLDVLLMYLYFKDIDSVPNEKTIKYEEHGIYIDSLGKINKRGKKLLDSLQNKLTFNFFITKMEKNTNLYDYLSGEIDENYWGILFQISVACYIMSLSKVIHNDLHPGNILVIKCPRYTMTYVINGKSYTFWCDYKVLVFDFDCTYSQKLGENPYLNDEWPQSYSQENRFVPNKDFIKFFCILYSYLHLGKEHLKIVTNDINYVDSLYSVSSYMQKEDEDGKLVAIEDEGYKKFYHMNQIVENVWNEGRRRIKVDTDEVDKIVIV